MESETGRLVLFAADGVALAAADIDPCTAARILGACRAERVTRGLVLDRLDAAAYTPVLEELRRLLGDEAFERELTAGAALTIDDAVELAFDLARRAGANVDSP